MSSCDSPRYTVGHTVAGNVPCILVDGDSVFAIFPSQPNGMEHAERVCRILNEESSDA
jgi:pyrimidine deaminase RibD-like protein